ncbi:GntR family transcriptional regulator [Streptomyces rapamycinicus]|nr:GntR family transcriptional regulator [Streptomyces rapamycinicus]MBB4787789.1 DNA-binding GntR family transcriptional regulator [Streptomyces rapamycinicus]UTP36556.1 GntR family transcriptional regulator [Streptomyces rapamycinicus NRRL 5491]
MLVREVEMMVRPQARIRVRLADEVADVLREMIYSGALVPGEKLKQQRLSDELGVSRTPLREAFRMLEQEGLVRVDSRQGVRVIAGDTETLLQAYAVREVVDGLAARLAAEERTSEDVTELHEIVDQQRASIRPWRSERYTQLNVAFHARIMSASHNDFVVAQMPLLRLTARVFSPFALLEVGTAARAIEQHVQILAAIESGAPEEAEQAARSHIRATTDRLERIR